MKLLSLSRSTKKQELFEHEIAVTSPPDASQAFVMLEQCRDVVLKIRRATKRIGVSLSLTYLLSLLEQCLDRIELLLYLVVDNTKGKYVSLGHLISDLTKAHYSEKCSLFIKYNK